MLNYFRDDFDLTYTSDDPHRKHITYISAEDMAKEFRSIMDVTPTTPKNWKIKVTVVEKGAISESRDKMSRYQHFVLADSDGARVQLTLFDPLIKMFSDRFHLFKTYYISNATVRPANLKYQIANHPYQWTLNPLCTIAETAEEISVSNRLHNFVSIDDLGKFRSSDSAVDVLVIVVQILPQKRVETSKGAAIIQQCVVLDKSLKPVILTFWEKFIKTEVAQLISIIDQRPILLGIRLKVSSYEGLSISSRSSSSFSINPLIQPARDLRSWMLDNMAMVSTIVNSDGLVTKALAFGEELTRELMTLETVQRSYRLILFHVKCYLEIQDYEQTVVYGACNLCGKATYALFKETFICNHCRKEVISVPKFRLEVRLSDTTSSMMATMSEVAAEHFLGCTIGLLIQNQQLDTPLPFRSLVNPDTNAEMKLTLRAYDSVYRGITTRRFHVTSLKISDAYNVLDNIEEEASTHASSSSFPVDLSDPELTTMEKQVLEKIVQRKKAKVQSSTSSSFEKELHASHNDCDNSQASPTNQGKLLFHDQPNVG